jgi:hypothetical protein
MIVFREAGNVAVAFAAKRILRVSSSAYWIPVVGRKKEVLRRKWISVTAIPLESRPDTARGGGSTGTGRSYEALCADGDGR